MSDKTVFSRPAVYKVIPIIVGLAVIGIIAVCLREFGKYIHSAIVVSVFGGIFATCFVGIGVTAFVLIPWIAIKERIAGSRGQR